jgi:hypothetical protein
MRKRGDSGGNFLPCFVRIGNFLHGWEGRFPLFGSASMGSLRKELGWGETELSCLKVGFEDLRQGQ